MPPPPFAAAPDRKKSSLRKGKCKNVHHVWVHTAWFQPGAAASSSSSSPWEQMLNTCANRFGHSNESWDKNHLFRSTKAPKQRQRAETGCSLSIWEAAAQIYHTVHIQVLSRWSCPLPGSVNGPKQHQLNHPFSSVVVWNQEVKKVWENYGSPERQTSEPSLVHIVAIVQQDKCSTFLHSFSHRWEKWLLQNFFFFLPHLIKLLFSICLTNGKKRSRKLESFFSLKLISPVLIHKYRKENRFWLYLDDQTFIFLTRLSGLQ